MLTQEQKQKTAGILAAQFMGHLVWLAQRGSQEDPKLLMLKDLAVSLEVASDFSRIIEASKIEGKHLI